MLGPDPRRRLALLVGVQARRAISRPGTASRSPAATTRSSSTSLPRPRARNISASARSRSAPTASSLATLVDDNGSERFKLRSATSPPARTSRPSPRSASASRCGRATATGIVFTEVNDQWRSYRARYHRLGDAGRAATSRSTRRPRSSASRSASARSQDRQPDLHLDRRQCDQRSALRPRRRPDRSR